MKSKLSRREAALVANARRNAVKQYKENAMTGVMINGLEMRAMTLRELEWYNYMHHTKLDLMQRFGPLVRLPSPFEHWDMFDPDDDYCI